MQIEINRLYLRELTLDDIETTFAYASDFENTHYMLMVPFSTREETKAFICKCIEEYNCEQPEHLSFAVVLDNRHIGEVFAYISDKEADIGWIIDKRYWGKGFATQAAKLLVEYLKNNLQIEEIVAYCDARNIPSQKVMEHIGMEYVGSNGIRTYNKNVSEYEELKYRKVSTTIRTMTIEDKSSVMEMMQVFYTSPAVLSNGSDEIFESDIENCVNDSPYLEGFIFEDGKEIQGYGMIAKSFSTEFGKPCIWIEDLYIKPKYRGAGIGSMFFDYLKDKYTNHIFRLEVEEDNGRAIHVYEKNGFTVLPYMEMKIEM